MNPAHAVIGMLLSCAAVIVVNSEGSTAASVLEVSVAQSTSAVAKEVNTTRVYVIAKKYLLMDIIGEGEEQGSDKPREELSTSPLCQSNNLLY